MGPLWREERILLWVDFEGGVRPMWALTSNLQADCPSSSASRTAGHTRVQTSIDLLHPSDVKGSVVNISPNKWRGSHLKLTWQHTWKCSHVCVCVLCPMFCVDLDLPLNHCTRGGGAPVAWHSSTASAPTETWIGCWLTFTLGASEETIHSFYLWHVYIFF